MKRGISPISGHFVVFGRNVEFTKIPCESFWAAYACSLAQPTPLHTRQERASFFWLQLLATVLLLSASEAQTLSWVWDFCSSFCVPQFFDQFRSLPQVEKKV